MYYLETEEHFDAAHFLKGYAGNAAICTGIAGVWWRRYAQMRLRQTHRPAAW